MKKTIFILTLLFVLAATPALATPGNGKSNEHAKNKQIQGIEIEPTDITPTEVTPTQVTPTKIPCDPNEEYKNHGKYVSCVAKTHPGGKVVSEAAKSNIGKKGNTTTITPSPSISPSISPEATATPTISPTIEPTPDASSTAETNSEENSVLGQQIKNLIDKINELLEMLKNLATS